MTWLTMLLVGIGSYAFRVVPVLVLPRFELSPRADRLLRHAGAAALTALVATSVTGSGGADQIVATLIAVAVAAVLAVTGSAMLRVVAGGAIAYAAITLLIAVTR
jgi:branched-subunit amino acid transport protein